MAFYDDLLKGNLVTGLALGVGALVLSPIVIPLIRPLAKGVIKVGLMAYDQATRAVGEVSEITGDIIAEAHHEHETRGSLSANTAAGSHRGETVTRQAEPGSEYHTHRGSVSTETAPGTA